MSKAPKKCPSCGAKKEWNKVAKDHKGFSAGKSLVGLVVAGPVGLVAGGLGKKKEAWYCSKCGLKQEY